MPAQSAREFRASAVHVNYFLQISNSVKPAAVAGCAMLADIPIGTPCQLCFSAWRQVCEAKCCHIHVATRLFGRDQEPQVIDFKMAAPQGFEPRYADPESAVLPLNEGAV